MMTTVAAVLLLLQAPLCRASGGNMAGYEARKSELRPIMLRVRSGKPVSTQEEFAAELKTAQKLYAEYIPEDYGKALGLQSVETWTEMQEWYKLASQEVSLMGQRALMLNKACAGMGRDLSGFKGESEKTLAAARKTLKFMSDAPWGDSLRGVIIGNEANKELAVRNVQIKAVKDWERLALCVSGELPGRGSGTAKKTGAGPGL